MGKKKFLIAILFITSVFINSFWLSGKGNVYADVEPILYDSNGKEIVSDGVSSSTGYNADKNIGSKLNKNMEVLPFDITIEKNTGNMAEELKQLISKIEKIDTKKFPEAKEMLDELEKSIQTLKARPDIYPGYYRELKKYLVNALKGISSKSKEMKNQQNVEHKPCVLGNQENKKAYWYSIIPFKKGDLYTSCDSSIQKALSDGFNQITLFYPVHYSGGAEVVKNYPLTKNKDYFYETANGIDEKEMSFCLDKIFKAGMKLNYVPHIESIVTMNSTGEAEWRIKSLLPVDDEYYKHFYTPIENYFKKNPKYSKLLKRVSIAAEIDGGFLAESDKSLKTLNRLKGMLKQVGALDAQVSWNPNGDFFHLPERAKFNCETILELLKSVDRISHTAYQGYGHIPYGPFDYNKTKTQFYSRLEQGLLNHSAGGCKNAKAIVAKLLNKPYSFGEFHLQDTGTDYGQAGRELRKYNSDATFWNSGHWDVHADTTSVGNSLRTFLGPCNVVEKESCKKDEVPMNDKIKSDLENVVKKLFIPGSEPERVSVETVKQEINRDRRDQEMSRERNQDRTRDRERDRSRDRSRDRRNSDRANDRRDRDIELK